MKKGITVHCAATHTTQCTPGTLCSAYSAHHSSRQILNTMHTTRSAQYKIAHRSPHTAHHTHTHTHTHLRTCAHQTKHLADNALCTWHTVRHCTTHTAVCTRSMLHNAQRALCTLHTLYSAHCALCTMNTQKYTQKSYNHPFEHPISYQFQKIVSNLLVPKWPFGTFTSLCQPKWVKKGFMPKTTYSGTPRTTLIKNHV